MTTVNGHAAADHAATGHAGCTMLVAVAVGAGTVQVNTYLPNPDGRIANQIATVTILR